MQPENRKGRLTRQWLAKTHRDLLAAERALQGSPPLRDVAAFHWQQAAEKALKAFLTWHDRPFRRSHDLLYLVQECAAMDCSFSQLADAAALLNPYATEFRYPGDVEEPTQEATDSARRASQEVVGFVEAALPRDAKP